MPGLETNAKQRREVSGKAGRSRLPAGTGRPGSGCLSQSADVLLSPSADAGLAAGQSGTVTGQGSATNSTLPPSWATLLRPQENTSADTALPSAERSVPRPRVVRPPETWKPARPRCPPLQGPRLSRFCPRPVCLSRRNSQMNGLFQNMASGDRPRGPPNSSAVTPAPETRGPLKTTRRFNWRRRGGRAGDRPSSLGTRQGPSQRSSHSLRPHSDPRSGTSGQSAIAEEAGGRAQAAPDPPAVAAGPAMRGVRGWPSRVPGRAWTPQRHCYTCVSFGTTHRASALSPVHGS